MVSRAYYTCAFVAVILFWISTSIRFIPRIGGADSPVAIFLVATLGILLPSGAILSAIGAYRGTVKGRICLAFFALLACAYLVIQIDIRISSGRYFSASEAQFYSILLGAMAVSHVALIIRSPAVNLVKDGEHQDES